MSQDLRMATRKSPLSLKARAIALLAQREHSVVELRRKLLCLAELRDLQAWQLEHEPAASAPADQRRVTDPSSGEPASAPGGRHARRPEPLPAVRRGVGSFDLDEDWDDGELDAFLEEWGEDHAPHGHLEAAPKGETRLASSCYATGLGGAGACPAPEPVPGRRSGRSRPATPSADAMNAVMDEQGRQARAEEVEQLLQWLQQRSYLSEARLVESRINARASRYGNLRIQQELRQLGVAPDEEQQARLKDSELDRARAVWQRKFGGEMPTDAASRARQMRFLAARGFSSEVVRRVLRGEDD